MANPPRRGYAAPVPPASAPWRGGPSRGPSGAVCGGGVGHTEDRRTSLAGGSGDRRGHFNGERNQTKYTYEPFGRTEATGTPNPNPFRFTGREDDSTGLYYYRARYYDPTKSRFVHEDPIGLAGGSLNLYAYSLNAPLTHIDPLGTDVFAVGWGGSYFLGSLSQSGPNRGYAVQGSLGVAYDSSTGELTVYMSSGNTGPDKGNVIGAAAGVGPTGAYVKGFMDDFLGQSREESATATILSGGTTVTPSGVKGLVWAGGGKGWGWGGTTIDTHTQALIRVRPSRGCSNFQPTWPQFPAPWAP